MIQVSNGFMTVWIMIGCLFLLGAILFLRSKLGRLKVMHTAYKGANIVLYASLDMEELKSLRQLIEKNK